MECQFSHVSERYTYLSQIKFDEWCVVTTPSAGIVDQVFVIHSPNYKTCVLLSYEV